MSITPEFFAPELDGVTVAVKELQNKVGEKAQMETSFAELTAELAAKMAIGKVSASTDEKYDVVTSSELGAGHFYDGFGYFGKLLNKLNIKRHYAALTLNALYHNCGNFVFLNRRL